ncbi:MAG TPA: hypothetical protein ACFYD3_06580 [Candidatus Hypogeohydataceae bacterium YC41]
MPYKVEIVDSRANNLFLSQLPKDLLPKVAEHLKLLGAHPYLGRSVEAPIPAYIYSFNITYSKQLQKFTVSYKINEGDETIIINSFGREIIKRR